MKGVFMKTSLASVALVAALMACTSSTPTMTGASASPTASGTGAEALCPTLQKLLKQLREDAADATGLRSVVSMFQPQMRNAARQMNEQVEGVSDPNAGNDAITLIADAQAIASLTPSSSPETFHEMAKTFNTDSGNFHDAYCSK